MSAIEIQAKALNFAQANIEANFRFAADLAKLRDVKEHIEVQSRHARSQKETYAEQTHLITGMMGEAARKSQLKPLRHPVRATLRAITRL